MEKLLQEILKKINTIEKRITQIENHLQMLTEEDEFVEEEGQPVFDEILPDAIKLLSKNETVSVVFFQKNLKIGYARAIRIVDILKQFEMLTFTDVSQSLKVNKDKVREFLKKDNEENSWN